MSLDPKWNSGGSKTEPHPDKEKSLRDILHVLTGVSVGQMTALKPAQRFSGLEAVIGGLRYRWHATSELTADGILVVAADDAPTAGRWLLSPGQIADLVLPFTFATADAAALLAVPAGGAIKLLDAWWEITADLTGGSSSAIGVSSDNTDLNTQGDILGGAGGDVAAGLVAGEFQGTTGAVDLSTNPIAGLIATEVVRYDRIVSAFTAGGGNVHVLAHITKNAGA